LFVSLIVTAGCESSTSFDTEQAVISNMLSSAFGISAKSTIQRSANSTNAEWEFEVPQSPERVRDLLKGRAPNGYRLIGEVPNRLSYGKTTKGDAFELTITVSAAQQSPGTNIAVTLRAYPD